MATDFSFQWKQRGGAPFIKYFFTLALSLCRFLLLNR